MDDVSVIDPPPPGPPPRPPVNPELIASLKLKLLVSRFSYTLSIWTCCFVSLLVLLYVDLSIQMYWHMKAFISVIW